MLKFRRREKAFLLHLTCLKTVVVVLLFLLFRRADGKNDGNAKLCRPDEYYEPDIPACRPCSVPCGISPTLCRHFGCKVGNTTFDHGEYFGPSSGRPRPNPCGLTRTGCKDSGDKDGKERECPSGEYYDTSISKCHSCDLACKIDRENCRRTGCEAYYNQSQAAKGTATITSTTPEKTRMMNTITSTTPEKTSVTVPTEAMSSQSSQTSHHISSLRESPRVIMLLELTLTFICFLTVLNVIGIVGMVLMYTRITRRFLEGKGKRHPQKKKSATDGNDKSSGYQSDNQQTRRTLLGKASGTTLIRNLPMNGSISYDSEESCVVNV